MLAWSKEKKKEMKKEKRKREEKRQKRSKLIIMEWCRLRDLCVSTVFFCLMCLSCTDSGP